MRREPAVMRFAVLRPTNTGAIAINQLDKLQLNMEYPADTQMMNCRGGQLWAEETRLRFEQVDARNVLFTLLCPMPPHLQHRSASSNLASTTTMVNVDQVYSTFDSRAHSLHPRLLSLLFLV